MNKYIAMVRVKGQAIRTMIFADSLIHARLILQYQFGTDSIIASPIQIGEAKSIKPITPDQQRIKSMQDQISRGQEVVKAERARQKIKAGQNQLAKVLVP